jgi:hypothetical protein
MELDYDGGVPAWGLTGGGSEVGEKLQGVKAVLPSYLSGAKMAGRAGPHGDPGRRRRGSSSARWMWCSRAAMEGLVSFTGSRRNCGRGCRGSGEAMVVCPRWTRRSPEKSTSGDGGSGARGEMRMQESAKWREEKLLNILDQQRRVGEARTGASHDGGEVAAGQSSGRGGATWSAREKARGRELGRRPAWR